MSVFYFPPVNSSYGIIDPIKEVIFTGPDIGNPSNRDFKITYGIAMSGKVYSTIKTPATEILLMHFMDIKPEQIAALKDFIHFTMECEIGYLDRRGNNWVGQFLNNPFSYSMSGLRFQDNRVEINGESNLDIGKYKEISDISLEFEGRNLGEAGLLTEKYDHLIFEDGTGFGG